MGNVNETSALKNPTQSKYLFEDFDVNSYSMCGIPKYYIVLTGLERRGGEHTNKYP